MSLSTWLNTMKISNKKLISVLAVLAVVASVSAQTTYFNLTGPVAGTFNINNTFWPGEEFTTNAAATAFTLNSVTLNLDGAADSSGNFRVQFFTDTGGGIPGTLLGTGIGTANPTTVGSNVYTFTGITLSASTNYWFIAEVTSGSGDYLWQRTFSPSVTGGWSADARNVSTNGGSTWSGFSSSDGLFSSVSATPAVVPEPGTYGLFAAVASLGLVLLRRRRVAV